MAAYTAISMGFSGVNVHAEDLLMDRGLINFVKSKDLLLFVWGDDLNDKTLIKSLKQDGVDGVVYDKVEEYRDVFIPSHDPRAVIMDFIGSSRRKT